MGAVHVQDGALWMNPAAERVIGYARSEITTIEAWFRTLYDDTSGAMLTRYEAQREAGFPKMQYGKIRRKDGQERLLEYRACTDVIGAIWIMDDITERAAMEAELLEAKRLAEISGRAKSEFLANMTHELRTPLTSIIGFAELLAAEGCDNPQHHRWIGRIEEASRGLLVIVNDVLDFSKLEDNSLSLEIRPFELRRLLAETTELLAHQAEKKGIALRLSLDEAVPELGAGDADRIRQILLNLLSNAVKFTCDGGVNVRARYETPAGLAIEVQDSGAGIPPAALTTIFDRFVQADGSISRQYGGTGLGLAITRRLAEMMGGEITVESVVGEGSTFRFTVPIQIVEGALAPLIQPAAPCEIGALHVLLAEDVEANQELISTILGAAGLQVTVVNNGVEAVEAAKGGGFDLILMDMHMPIMGGLEATRRIRRLDGETARVPIVALSANVLPEQVAEGREAGMDAHVGKPINPRELLTTIAACVGVTNDDPISV
jgi:PAS domain S-box-containing protein